MSFDWGHLGKLMMALLAGEIGENVGSSGYYFRSKQVDMDRVNCRVVAGAAGVSLTPDQRGPAVSDRPLTHSGGI
jgi:hypothetical protein